MRITQQLVNASLAAYLQGGTKATAGQRDSASAAQASATPRPTTMAGNGGVPLSTIASVTGMSVEEVKGFTSYSVSGPAVTSRFSGNNDTFSMTDTDGTVVTLYATGTEPNATKGALVRYGPGIGSTAQKAATDLALRYLAMHSNDHQLPGGDWDKSTYDFHA